MGSFLLGLLPKFLAAFISRRLDAWQARRAMRELGRAEQRNANLEEVETKRRDAEADLRKVEGGGEDLRNDL